MKLTKRNFGQLLYISINIQKDAFSLLNEMQTSNSLKSRFKISITSFIYIYINQLNIKIDIFFYIVDSWSRVNKVFLCTVNSEILELFYYCDFWKLLDNSYCDFSKSYIQIYVPDIRMWFLSILKELIFALIKTS